jgi:hypothetical protein
MKQKQMLPLIIVTIIVIWISRKQTLDQQKY